MTTVRKFSQGLDAPFSISDLAERTGLTPTTLRTWETRHGFPEPVRRSGGGHRRYTEAHVEQVRQVLRRRADGMTLEAAIQEASQVARSTDPSVFAGLRRRHPTLAPSTLRKSTLLALTHAMEDECCARAEDPLLVAGFQHERYYRRSRARWEDLTRTARSAVVLAAFPGRHQEGGTHSPVLVDIPERAPVRREWFLVCDAPDLPACLSAWELPGQEGVADRDRLFESVWSLDPAVVRDAALIALALAASFDPGRAPALPEPPGAAPPAVGPAVVAATQLFNRVLAYVDRA